MVASKEIEKLEKSRVRLSVTVLRTDAVGEYQRLVKEYAGKAQIKGFRPGKVPVDVLERKFGDSLKLEATQNLIETSLKEVFEEISERPLPYSMPELSEGADYKYEGDLKFTVVYDVYPEIQLGTYKGLEVERPEVKISDDDEKRELDAIVEQNSFIIDKDGVVAGGDIATVTYFEVNDDGVEVPGSRRSNFVVTVGSGYNPYKFDDDLVGMKKGEARDLTKSFPDDFEAKELAGATKRIRVELTALKEKKLPEVNDELAQDLSDKYETLADLKNDIRRRLEESKDARLRAITIEMLMEKVAEKSSVVLPESMVQAELDHSWQQFLSRFRGAKEDQIVAMLGAQNRTKESLVESWRPNAEKSLVVRLLIEKMIETEKVNVSDEEIDAELGKQAESSSTKFEELKDYYTKNRLLDAIRHDLQERRLFDAVLAETKVRKGKAVKLVDVLGGNR